METIKVATTWADQYSLSQSRVLHREEATDSEIPLRNPSLIGQITYKFQVVYLTQIVYFFDKKLYIK